ncbi:hypothetical protein [Kitasatospora sp. NPDC059673]|uniref:hypothetical protein n=1 Tax=Kitasatospora sp. NPDC059673 TaxID=3346901 RepID=UPI00367B10DA
MNTDHARALELIRGAETATLQALSGDDGAAGEAHRLTAEAARLLEPITEAGPCQRKGCTNAVMQRATGRPRLYCGAVCQQAAYWARKADAA